MERAAMVVMSKKKLRKGAGMLTMVPDGFRSSESSGGDS